MSAVALAAWAKGLALPAGKVARLPGQLGVTITPGGVTQAPARPARQTPYPPGRAVTGPDSPDPASDLKQERYGALARLMQSASAGPR
jgi:hypothetical protein